MLRLLQTELIGLLGLCFLVTAVVSMIAHLRRPPAKQPRMWIAGQLVLATILFWISRLKVIEFTNARIDRNSVSATFKSISVEGPRRQLVFHYSLVNATGRVFRIDESACSTVGFRFLEKIQSRPVLTGQANPGLSLLERDPSAYAEFTGLQRLPTTNPALSLDPCPLELQPQQSREVAIAIPYAYPAAKGPNPSADDLKTYARTFMPRIDGFGLSDLARNYEIIFPRQW